MILKSSQFENWDDGLFMQALLLDAVISIITPATKYQSPSYPSGPH